MLLLLVLACVRAPDPLQPLRAADAELAALLPALEQAERELLGEPPTVSVLPQAVDAEGVTLDMGLRLLERVEEHYVVAPDWAAMAAAGDRALAEAGSEVPGATAARTREEAADRLRSLARGRPDVDRVVVTWIDGALSALDPNTRAIWPAAVAGWEAHHEGVYVGVGVELVDAPDGVRVRWPVPGSPAFEAGLKQDDRVVAVDGREVATSVEAAGRLRGEEGTTVAVEVARRERRLGFELQRRGIVPDTVTGWTRAPDNRWDPWLDRDAGIAYARVGALRPHTDEALDALLEPVAGDVRAVVLDLRGCPGGDLDAAAQLADRFVREGTLVRLEGRRLPPPPPEGVVAWNEAVEGHALEGLPLAVLVDEHTASSAEVVAAALDQLAGALVIGEPTFGKGSSQLLLAEPDLGVALQVTNYRWNQPDGRPLDGHGLDPDERIPLSLAAEYQVGLMRRHREFLRVHADGTPLRVDLPEPRADLPVLPADPHVLRARLRLAERLAAGGGS